MMLQSDGDEEAGTVSGGGGDVHHQRHQQGEHPAQEGFV